jgi:4-hydroxybenzoate polyprenyltransferase
MIHRRQQMGDSRIATPPAEASTADQTRLREARVERTLLSYHSAQAAGTRALPRHLRTAIGLLRCEQWIKNGFVFAGMFFGHLASLASWVSAAVAFVLFSAVASASYIQNDLADREADRQHLTKRHRPIASGAISPVAARMVQAALLALGLAGAALFNIRILGVLVGYVALNVAYSSFLKHQVVLDVMVIGVGFVLRVVAGCLAVRVAPSVWILLCTFLLALYLGFGKRRHELLLMEAGMTGHRRVLDNYGIKFLDQMIMVVSALTITSYIMFTVWPDTVAYHGTPNLVYTVPFVLYGLFRYDYLVYRAEESGNPTDALLTDPPLLATLALWATACAAIMYWK